MVKCPICGKEVRVIPFGSAFIGVCCSKIIYRGYKLPETGINTGDGGEPKETGQA
ncbi:MAG: hypothetical protein H6Q52_112 [Deltaproteobacteria bacterium]|nr:hypothetical protein [Deltaproteobacteria bacterium]